MTSRAGPVQSDRPRVNRYQTPPQYGGVSSSGYTPFRDESITERAGPEPHRRDVEEVPGEQPDGTAPRRNFSPPATVPPPTGTPPATTPPPTQPPATGPAQENRPRWSGPTNVPAMPNTAPVFTPGANPFAGSAPSAGSLSTFGGVATPVGNPREADFVSRVPGAPNALPTVSGSYSGITAPQAFQTPQTAIAPTLGQFSGGYTGVSGPTAFQAPSAVPAFQGQGLDRTYQTQGAPVAAQLQGFDPVTATGGSGLNNALLSQVMASLGAPSSYGSDAVQQTFGRLSGQIDDDFTQRERLLEEDMARRGLADSSIRGGRLQDLNVGRRSARTELADRLIEQQAQTQSSDTARAIAQAMGLQGQQFGQAATASGINQNITAGNFARDLAARQFGAGEEGAALNAALQLAGFNNSVGQQGFENKRSAFGDTLASQGQQFGQQMDAARFLSGERGREFDYGMSKAGFNNDALQQGFQNQRSLYGDTLAGQGQRFGQEMDSAGFQSGERGRELDYLLGMTGFNRDSLQGDFGNRQSAFDQLLGADQQRFGQRLAAGQFAAAEDSRVIGENRTTSGFNNSVTQQNYDNQRSQLDDALNIQGFNQNLAQQGFNNAITSQQQQQGLRGQAFNEQLATEDFNLQQERQRQELEMFILGLGGR